MSVDIKICGLSQPDMLEAALDAGAAYVGLVFYEPSPRNVTIAQAHALAEQARGRAAIVALTVDAPDALLRDISRQVRPDFLQAHGSETPDRVREMTKLTGLPVIKAIKVRDSHDVGQARDYAGVAAMVLFDARAPEALADALPGGNGIAFRLDASGRGRTAARDSCCRAGSTVPTSPRPSASPARPPSMSRPAWSARPASRTPS
jgi:phosphoribosylanthranilate isomerase